MSSAAWNGWMAVKLLAELMLRASDGSGDLTSRLRDPGLRLDGHKGTPLSFRADGWLRHPLYVLRAEPASAGAPLIEEVPFDEEAMTAHLDCLPE